MLFGLDRGEGFETCFRSEQIRSFGFQGACLCSTTSTSPVKMKNEFRAKRRLAVRQEG